MERKHRRYAVDLTVDASTRDMLTSSRVSNISRGGMFVESPKPLPLHSDVWVTLHLGSSGRTISAHGFVAWTRDVRKGSIQLLSGNGIRFSDLAPMDRIRLEAFLADLADAAATSAGPGEAPAGH